jgi:rod shape-determining protein MreC
MQNLFQLFLRLSGLIVFVLLEVFCFTLIVKYNQRQKDIYANSSNLLSSYLNRKSSDVQNYLELYDINQKLAEENAVLMEKLAALGIDTSNHENTVPADSMTSAYSLYTAKVIRNSINQIHNYLLINKGSKNGIQPGYGVVTPSGVIGIVRRVSSSHSLVMSVLHRQSKISAQVKGKYHFGSLVWNGQDTRIFNLEDVPKFAPVVKGDTIETSGYSSIFPPGIMLGIIENMWMEPGSNFYNIEVRYSLDLSNIQFVQVVKNYFKEEQDSLIQAVIREDE